MTKKAIAARRNITLQRDRFVEEYLRDLNATQAAIRSGYPRKSAHVIGRRLLEDAEVVAAVDQGKAEAPAAACSVWKREVLSLARTTPVSLRTMRIKLEALTLLGRGRKGSGSRGGDNAERRDCRIVIVSSDNGPLPPPTDYPTGSAPTPSRNSEVPSHSYGSAGGETECNTSDGEESMEQTTKRHDHRGRAVNAIAARRDATLRRDRFVEEYQKDLNPTQAAIRSGYQRKSAHLIGRRLLMDAEVLAAVDRGRAEAAAAARSVSMREGLSLATTTPVNPRTMPIKLAALTLLRRALPDVFHMDDRGDGKGHGPMSGDGAERPDYSEVVLYLPDNGRGDGPVPLPPLKSKLPKPSPNDSSSLKTEP
jgi:phage terminase small subunit